MQVLSSVAAAKKVLIVEDYADARAMMRFVIEQHGYSVIEAAGAYEAIEKAAEYHPDLILMDIGLPLMDGLSTAAIIKGMKDLAHVPIIAVTAYSDVREQALKAGCREVLYKPVEFPDLTRMLDEHLLAH